MAIRTLPNLSPAQVVRLTDALLSNANRLFQSARVLLDADDIPLARSIAILGMEESAKAIALHQRRIEIVREAEGAPFRCDWLDALWASHEKKLHLVHRFLVDEEYWFGVEAADPERNAAELGAIRGWASRHDRAKLRGFYVDISRTGDVMKPDDLDDRKMLEGVLDAVHQIGWQLRLGEHIEGKRQNEREAGRPPAEPEAVAWFEAQGFDASTLREGKPGVPLRNAGYRFFDPNEDHGDPLRTFGKPGYEAQTRELFALMSDIDADRMAAEAATDETNSPTEDS